MDLFSGAQQNETIKNAPLADRMRPRNLNDIIGQDHIVGVGRLLRRSIAADRLSSVIFYGPPGTGKTSLARVIANTTKGAFESLNAVLAGIKDIRDAIDRAQERQNLYSKKTILFVDEVHRWNKAQQDALLPWVENGTVILVGATTENPFFEVNKALVSRSRVFQLKALANDDLLKAANAALHDTERGYGNWNVQFAQGALEHLVEVSSGDARCLLNALELVVETTPPCWPPAPQSTITITLQAAEDSIQKRAVLYDKDGDYHFDTISAFIKSVRGSDPDASLYWLAKMVQSGEDPAFIFRRMIILASEDVGLADPLALQVVISCAESFERIGFPEGNYPLSHACLYLATAPKSNSTMAFFDALKVVEKEDGEVPNHLRDASRDGTSFGHGVGYNYPHAFRDHWTAQQYLPTSLQGKMFYTPSMMGYEKKIYNDVMQKRELQAAAILSRRNSASGIIDADAQLLSWTPQSKKHKNQLDMWLKRLESTQTELLLKVKQKIFELAALKRHDRVLLVNADDGLLLWESMRCVPEGFCAALVSNAEAKETLQIFSASLYANDTNQSGIELPKIEAGVEDGTGNMELQQACKIFDCNVYDTIIVQEPLHNIKTEAVLLFEQLAKDAKIILQEGGKIILIITPSAAGETLCRILERECAVSVDLIETFNNACKVFRKSQGHQSVETDKIDKIEKIVTDVFCSEGFSVDITTIEQSEQRLLHEKEIDLWFDASKSIWGASISKQIEENDFKKIKTLLTNRVKQGPVEILQKSCLVKACI